MNFEKTLFSQSLNFAPASGDVILLMDLWNYSNPSGSLYNGQCCDTYMFSSNCSGLSSGCNVRLKICVDSATNLADAANSESCTHYSTVLNSLPKMNTFNFKDNPQALQPFITNLYWNQPTLVKNKKTHFNIYNFFHIF